MYTAVYVKYLDKIICIFFALRLRSGQAIQSDRHAEHCQISFITFGLLKFFVAAKNFVLFIFPTDRKNTDICFAFCPCSFLSVGKKVKTD